MILFYILATGHQYQVCRIDCGKEILVAFNTRFADALINLSRQTKPMGTTAHVP
jgi:hypothetical protein